MKIAVVGTRGVPNLMGGIETHCEELYPRIVRRGYDVMIFRRDCYVHDHLTEYQGCHLIDVNTPKIKSLEVIVHTFKAILAAIIGGLIGTCGGARFLNMREDYKMKKVRTIAIKALDVIRKYSKHAGCMS